jgi:guanosine-3',5'-bis(diphosphate) 3'-pyrophosphohydrolase
LRHVISEAIAFATKTHHGQFDKAGHPYILHPLKVMYLLKSDDEELMAIAVLHDVVEDCFADDHEAGFAALKAIGMTKRVIDAVRLLTKRKGQDYDEYIAGILTNKDAIRGKMADLRHNMDLRRLKGVTDKDMKRIEKYTRTYHKLKIALEAVDIL